MNLNFSILSILDFNSENFLSGAKKWNQIFSFILFSIYLIFQVKRVNFSAPSPRKMGSWSHYSAGGFTCQIGFSVQSWMDLVYVFQLGWKMRNFSLQIRGARSQVFSRQEKKSAVISHDDVVKSKWCQGFVDIFLWRQLPTHLISLLWIFIMGETFCHTSGLLFACINNIKTMTSFQTKFSGSSVIWSDNFSVSEALK